MGCGVWGLALNRIVNGTPSTIPHTPHPIPRPKGFHPPSIEHRKIGDTVDRGFHAAGATGFEWSLRIVHPYVHAAHEVLRDVNAVVLNKRNATTECRVH